MVVGLAITVWILVVVVCALVLQLAKVQALADLYAQAVDDAQAGWGRALDREMKLLRKQIVLAQARATDSPAPHEAVH